MLASPLCIVLTCGVCRCMNVNGFFGCLFERTATAVRRGLEERQRCPMCDVRPGLNECTSFIYCASVIPGVWLERDRRVPVRCTMDTVGSLESEQFFIFVRRSKIECHTIARDETSHHQARLLLLHKIIAIVNNFGCSRLKYISKSRNIMIGNSRPVDRSNCENQQHSRQSRVVSKLIRAEPPHVTSRVRIARWIALGMHLHVYHAPMYEVGRQ